MNHIHTVALATVLMAAMSSTSVLAGERAVPATAQVRTAPSLVQQALSQLRAERQEALKLEARRALAAMRSETASALAQGATVPASPAIRTER